MIHRALKIQRNKIIYAKSIYKIPIIMPGKIIYVNMGIEQIYI